MRNLFTITFLDRSDEKVYKFIIHKLQNDLLELLKFVNDSKLILIGFNNLSYDYPLLHHILNHYQEYLNVEANELTWRLYKKSQEIIESEFSIVADKNTKIPQIDVYKIHHWDNPAKATSLFLA